KSLAALSSVASSRATPTGSDVVVAGMSQASQCQNPESVGASGSEQVTAKERVPSGAPEQERSGERFSPPSEATSCWGATSEPSGVAFERMANESWAGMAAVEPRPQQVANRGGGGHHRSAQTQAAAI